MADKVNWGDEPVNRKSKEEREAEKIKARNKPKKPKEKRRK